MKALIRNTAAKCLLNVLSAAWAATLPLDAVAQPSPDDFDKLVDYAQCIRANGYPDFPDPKPDGFQFRITPGTAAQFQKAQEACKDKIPPGIAAMDAPPTPEALEAMVKFAACVRESGVPEFPDPTPQGTFEVGRELDMRTPQAQQALQSCREQHPVGALRLRIGG